ncbi:MAG: AMP-binding protein [Rhodospirillales bacterium]|nr:AMP-binding protein [Rhodospirillales bacterium]
MTPRAPGGGPSAHRDPFVRERLPPRDLWPILDYSGSPELAAYPDRMNIAQALLGRAMALGFGDQPVYAYGDVVWSYRHLWDRAQRVARWLVETKGLVPGNRVMLRGTNTPMQIAAWFGVAMAGGVAVPTMPMLRARELGFLLERAQVTHALCDIRLIEELAAAKEKAPSLRHLAAFTALGDASHAEAELDRALQTTPAGFAPLDTAADDPVLIAFTSGTTGNPKGTIHFHRDLLAITDACPRYQVPIRPGDMILGTPPIAFTYGLGVQVLFPTRHLASVALLDQATPERLLETIQRQRVTMLFSAPTMFRALQAQIGHYDLRSLERCLSGGEHLPAPTWESWNKATGHRLVDVIGATEMLHIFMGSPPLAIRPGATGKALPGYRARLVDEAGNPIEGRGPGRLAVIGPTGCRYFDDAERQKGYVKQGWNLTGDVFERDEDGYFWYQARSDDMIVSAGYNIAGPEVERVLLEHAKVAECAVIGAPDAERGQIVKAFVVLKDGRDGGSETVKELQDFVKSVIAPYKYPRAIVFRDDLPKTPTGKIQRFKLKEEA